MGWEWVATLAAGLFAGAAVYINVVEHPARVDCGTELAIREFGPSYHRAAVVQALLAAIGCFAGAGAWISGESVWWLIGGVIQGAVIPFTLVVIFPTNKKLLDPSIDRQSQEAGDLLATWARLHLVRSALGLAAFTLFVWLLAFQVT